MHVKNEAFLEEFELMIISRKEKAMASILWSLGRLPPERMSRLAMKLLPTMLTLSNQPGVLTAHKSIYARFYPGRRVIGEKRLRNILAELGQDSESPAVLITLSYFTDGVRQLVKHLNKKIVLVDRTDFARYAEYYWSK